MSRHIYGLVCGFNAAVEYPVSIYPVQSHVELITRIGYILIV